MRQVVLNGCRNNGKTPGCYVCPYAKPHYQRPTRAVECYLYDCPVVGGGLPALKIDGVIGIGGDIVLRPRMNEDLIFTAGGHRFTGSEIGQHLEESRRDPIRKAVVQAGMPVLDRLSKGPLAFVAYEFLELNVLRISNTPLDAQDTGECQVILKCGFSAAQLAGINILQDLLKLESPAEQVKKPTSSDEDDCDGGCCHGM